MCRIYNTIGALNDIRFHLVRNNLDEFNSLDELIHFEKSYHSKEQEVILKHTLLLQQEKIVLEKDIATLIEAISKTESEHEQQLKQRLDFLKQEIENLSIANSEIIPMIKEYWLNMVIWIKIWFTPLLFRCNIIITKRKYKLLLSKNNNRYQHLSNNFTVAVNESSSLQLQKLQLKRTVIKGVNNSIYGALGEQKVVDVLESLSDDYILINDFRCTFYPPIYNRKENDHIKSVQIDHLLISPSGIFLIETKNWSNHSIANKELRSPVQQVKRTNYALYRLLSNEIKKSNLSFTRNHWGDRKIPIRNLIVFINNKPNEEFQFTKILALDELNKYIKYFTPSFTNKETEMIADILLKISDRNEISSKLNV